MEKPNGELRLTFRKKQSGRTFLARQFYSLPLQITVPYYQDDDGTAFLALLNMGGGIFGSDYFRTQVLVEDGAKALITNLSATKIYKALGDDCSLLENEFSVGENAALEYMPECCVPFENSASFQKNTFRLKKSSFLFATDFVTPGRIDMGEKFSYRKYASDFKIFVDDRLIARERADVRPDDMNISGMGILEGYNNYVSIFIYCGKMNNEFIKEAKAVETEGVYYGCSRVDENLVIVKMLGDSTENIKRAIEKVWDVSRKAFLGKNKVYLRKL